MFKFINNEIGIAVDFNGMGYEEKEISTFKKRFVSINKEMQKIEDGQIKNPDEHRKVTHFTDRKNYPNEKLFKEVQSFVEKIRNGEITGSTGKKFTSAVINGIGGSALGPEFMQFAINGPYWNEVTKDDRKGYLKIYFTDNTDSSGITDICNVVKLEKTLVINISKSGGTQEPKNNIIAFKKIFSSKEIDYSKHFCAITMENSALDREAKCENWLKVFPMADSIGGRTSETSIVGHLPAAIAGINFKEFLIGACTMDNWTRNEKLEENPAYMLALMWYLAGNGKGDKNMVIVPYSDRLVLLSKYFQQLVMESLGKEKDLQGNIVHQGISVFGNKGGTDAHAYIQQLNDGRNDFFATFIEVLKDAAGYEISDAIYMGDYLHGFQNGLVNALTSKGRQVIQIQIKAVNEYNLGAIIALYERAVAAYGELINVNAFNQPGVQAYKLASVDIIKLTSLLVNNLKKSIEFKGTAKQLCATLRLDYNPEEVCGILSKFSENLDSRHFNGVNISREGVENNWIYTISKK